MEQKVNKMVEKQSDIGHLSTHKYFCHFAFLPVFPMNVNFPETYTALHNFHHKQRV